MKLIEEEKNEAIDLILQGFNQQEKKDLMDKTKKIIRATRGLQKRMEKQNYRYGCN